MLNDKIILTNEKYKGRVSVISINPTDNSMFKISGKYTGLIVNN